MRPTPEQYAALRKNTAFRTFQIVYILAAAVFEGYMGAVVAIIEQTGTPSIDFGPFNAIPVVVFLSLFFYAIFIVIQTKWAHRMPGASNNSLAAVDQTSMIKIGISGFWLALKVFYWVILGAGTIVALTYLGVSGILIFAFGSILYVGVKWILSKVKKVDTSKEKT